MPRYQAITGSSISINPPSNSTACSTLRPEATAGVALDAHQRVIESEIIDVVPERGDEAGAEPDHADIGERQPECQGTERRRDREANDLEEERVTDTVAHRAHG